MKNYKRTLMCGELRGEHAESVQSLCGWVARARDLGSLIFITLRDRTGIVQLVLDKDTTDPELFAKAGTLRSECVIAVTGNVRMRTPDMINPNMKTGEIEVVVTSMEILSYSEVLPFEISEAGRVSDNVRLKYRYLDLRRAELQANLIMKHEVSRITREYLSDNGFLEIETPMLTKSTPEGARDYIVPSRIKQGAFYALPQSPQLFKQLLMISGFDRYFQLARCFRDEDLRADRQPEFTQIDMELSFVDEEDVMAINEGLVAEIFKKTIGVEVALPLTRLTYREAMDRFGSDKPDMRFGLELCNVSDIAKGCSFKVFADAVENGMEVRAINAKGLAGKMSRKDIDSLGEFVKTYKAKGLAWYAPGVAPRGSFLKAMDDNLSSALIERLGAEEGDILFFVADKAEVVFASLGALRCEIAKRYELITKGDYKFLWVTDFPMFEYDEEENRLVAMHHPFTHPKDEDIELIETAPEKMRAKAYDLVLNGTELGGGSIRIHTTDLQERMLKALSFTKEQAWESFGFLLDALRFGAPPHGGLAFGLDRIIMHLTGAPGIRDTIAFPKVQTAADLMSGAPDMVSEKQLKELGITVPVKEKEEE